MLRTNMTQYLAVACDLGRILVHQGFQLFNLSVCAGLAPSSLPNSFDASCEKQTFHPPARDSFGAYACVQIKAGLRARYGVPQHAHIMLVERKLLPRLAGRVLQTPLLCPTISAGVLRPPQGERERPILEQLSVVALLVALLVPQ